MSGRDANDDEEYDEDGVWSEEDDGEDALSATVYVEKSALEDLSSFTIRWFQERLGFEQEQTRISEPSAGDGVIVVTQDDSSPIVPVPYRTSDWEAAALAGVAPSSIFVAIEPKTPRGSITKRWVSRQSWPVEDVTYYAFSVDLNVAQGYSATQTGRALADQLCALAANVDAIYGAGAVNYGVPRPWTSLDLALDRPWEESLSDGRRHLRGYDWVTIVPKELADRVRRAVQEEAGSRSRITASPELCCLPVARPGLRTLAERRTLRASR